MPMHQLCGAGCDGQLRYGGSSRPSNILFPGLGCNSGPMHYMRTGGGPAPVESSRSARYALGGGCGAFSASMAQLASPAQCSSRVKQLHAVVGGTSSGSHRLCSSSSTMYCNSPFHGPYAGHSALAVAGGLPRGPSQQLYGQCGPISGGGGVAAAAGSLYCSSSILGSASSSRRGSCCSSVLPPQSHSHQIAKQLEQQQLEMEEAAAGTRGHCVFHGHYQYHDFSKHHGGGESCYSHLFPEKLHDWVEVIKHPRSHSTQATRIALSSLHIGECPGVPENASSFAMKRTGTLKWQPGSVLEEDDDSVNVSCNPNNCDRSDSSKNSSRSSSKSSSRIKSGKGSRNNTSKNNGNSSSNSLGLSTKARHHLSRQEPKNELAGIVPALGSPAGFTDELATKTDIITTGGPGGAHLSTVIPRHDEVVTVSSAAVAEAEKTRGSRKGRDMTLSGLFTAAAVVGLPAGTRATTEARETAEETRRASCATVQGAEEESVNKETGRGKRKKTLGFRKRTTTVNLGKPPGGARVQRCQKNRDAMQGGWAVAEATHCGAVIDGERATTATGSSSSGNSSGSSGGESDNSGSTFMVSPPSHGSALSCLSGRESECSGSPRKHHPESAGEDAPHADNCAPAAGTGGPETLKKNFSWHKLRQKLKL